MFGFVEGGVSKVVPLCAIQEVGAAVRADFGGTGISNGEEREGGLWRKEGEGETGPGVISRSFGFETVRKAGRNVPPPFEVTHV